MTLVVLLALLLVGSILVVVYQASSHTSYSFYQASSHTSYSFYLAGHAYGNPRPNAIGLYPKFVSQFPYISKNDSIKFGVLLGDIVFHSTEESWHAVKAELERTNKPYHFVPGNHDITDRALYQSLNGEFYSHFQYGPDLFVILDASEANWSISDQQLEFLSTLIKTSDYRHLFVFTHQLVWWGILPQHKRIKVNSIEGRSEPVNFWSHVVPILSESNHEVFVIAGDIGAFDWTKGTYYDRHENIHLVGTGMGSGIDDNILIVTVPGRDSVRIDVLDLTGSGSIRNALF